MNKIRDRNTIKLTLTAYTKERCAICGKFIALRDLGTKAIKINDGYLSDFAHVDCIAKRANNTIDILNKKEAEYE